MPLTTYTPRDPERYPRHEGSRKFSPTLSAGVYVYVQDCAGVVWIAPDGFHMHPRVLGRARPVVAAGELTLGENGEVLLINNLSGTFRCASDCLFPALGGLIVQGATVTPDAIRRYET